jgi:cobalt/nickel transport system ATP-binding protein
VFQNANNQLFAQSVKQEIEFALRNFGYEQGVIDQRTAWALNIFSLTEYADRPPIELSGGEKKRLTLACVLAWDPEVVVMDGFSAHADRDDLLDFVKGCRSSLRKLFLVHGEEEQMLPLGRHLTEMGIPDVQAPMLGELARI